MHLMGHSHHHIGFSVYLMESYFSGHRWSSHSNIFIFAHKGTLTRHHHIHLVRNIIPHLTLLSIHGHSLIRLLGIEWFTVSRRVLSHESILLLIGVAVSIGRRCLELVV